jgi:putative membrane protein
MEFGRSHSLKTWFLHLILFYREHVFRKLIPIMLVISLYAFTIVYIDVHTNRFEKIELMNLGQFHLIYSFIIGILVSFRVNTSYARWWEGRIIWGNLVNNCRNLGLKFETFAGLYQYPQFLAYLQIYPRMLKLHLRKDYQQINKQFAQLGITNEIHHPMIYLNGQLYQIINDLRKQNLLQMEQYLALDSHVANLMDITGACERIANTPVPTAFAFFVKQALLFYALMFPFGWFNKFGYFIVPMILMIVYVLLGLELLSEELENPFGTDDHDLPLEGLSSTIANNLEAIANLSSTTK